MKIFSIFNSINGEVGIGQGTFTTFIRFAGCLKTPCKWCDTKYALDVDSSNEMTAEEIVRKVDNTAPGCRNVTITGGEPMIQLEGLLELIELLHVNHRNISLETNGAFSFSLLEQYFIDCIVADYKTPSSGIDYLMCLDDEFAYALRKQDWIKFVIADIHDYNFAAHKVEKLMDMGCKANIAFSPMNKGVTPSRLIHWIQEDHLFNIVVNLQLHKLGKLKEPK